MYRKILQYSSFGIFWIPLSLALVDLTFFVSVSLLFVFTISAESTDSISIFLSYFQELVGLQKPQFVIVLLLLIISVRSIYSYFVKCIFSISISSSYSNLTEVIYTEYMNAISSNRLVDKDYCRKVLNAETVNLFFGVIVPFSFVLAEFLVIVTSFSYAIYVFGISIIPGAGMVLFALFLVMLVMRHKARVVGEDRAAFERKKLKIVELLLQASYMISINGGGNWFKSQFLETNKGFASALGQQTIFPYFTKSLVDGVLVLTLALVIINFGGEIGDAEMAILIGIGLRAIPATSRLAAYVETMRINKVGAFDALRLEKELKSSQVADFESVTVTRFLSKITHPGVFIIKGPSGTGKTTAIKKWISERQRNFHVAYFDQSGFSESVSFHELAKLLSSKAVVSTFTDKFSLKTQSRLEELSGGQSAFLQLSLLLDKEAEIYAFEEPSVGLDKALQLSLAESSVKKSKLTPVVIITHDSNFIETLSILTSINTCEL